MAAVVRVKRRLNEEPLNTLILNCKKRKIDADSTDNEGELSTILKLAGTLQNQEDALTHLKKPSKIEIEQQFKKPNIEWSAKLKTQKLEDSKNSRYRIVNCYRSSDNSNTTEAEEPDQNLTIYDIEAENHDKEQDPNPGVEDSSSQYVYDVYYTSCDDLGDAYLEDYVSVYPCSDELIYGSRRDNGAKQSDSEDDSEDSNAECNWRNDYPDESDMESVNEEDMIAAMKQVDLSDLSSDEEEVYYDADEKSESEDLVDDHDVNKYGSKYARFKAKHSDGDSSMGGIVSSGLNNSRDLYYGDIDEEEYYY